MGVFANNDTYGKQQIGPRIEAHEQPTTNSSSTMLGMFIFLGILILLLAIFWTRSPAPVIPGPSPTADTSAPWWQSFYGAATPAGGWFAFFQRLGWGIQV
ncbi:hypothetical protein V8F33_013849 [Rhypophila sp. PSN 637]